MRNRVHYADLAEDGYLGPPLCGRVPDACATKSRCLDGSTPPEEYIDCKWCLKKLRERRAKVAQ